MEFETILFEVTNHLATVTLNRPNKLNALNAQLMVDLRAAFKICIANQNIRCLLVTGAGRAFCAGVDLTPSPGKFEMNPNDPQERLRDYLTPMVELLRQLRIPTIAAVNGPCAGVGMSLALTCDIVLAARSAYFMQAFAQVGLVPDTGSSWLLTHMVGSARATALMLTAEKLPAEKALEWGMIWKCVDDEQLMAEAGRLGGHLANGPTYTYTHIKKLAQHAPTNGLREQISLENDYQYLVRLSEDAQEARAAFNEKRKPMFKGR
jgi:2-(1,2-epoxy-1,2-dihydrophenyl)acetyl-CoA isomerase